MPVSPTFPGVYIEEVPSGVRTITGVATSIAAFLGYFKRGPMNKPRRVLGLADFEREFGGLDRQSEAGYAIQQFFLNGGTQAWVVRAASPVAAIPASGGNPAVPEKPATAATVELLDNATGGNKVLTATAKNEGTWGNGVRIDVDYRTSDPTTTFNLTVTEFRSVGGRKQLAATEVFRNLVLDDTKSNDAVAVVNDGSKLINLELAAGATGKRPAETSGTFSKTIDQAALTGLAVGDTMDVFLNGGAKRGTIALEDPVPKTTSALADFLGKKLRSLDLPEATVETVRKPGDTLLQISSGAGGAKDLLTFTGGLAVKLGLDVAANVNLQTYGLGAITAGSDGIPPDATALKGERSKKTGLFALLDVDLFNILCIPDTVLLSDAEAAVIASEAEAFCQQERAFYILDMPQKASVRDEIEEAEKWLTDNASLRNKNAAAYFPRPLIADPLDEFRLRPIAASGTIAGVYARTDGERGVWKAPAGSEAVLRGVQKLERPLTDGENGVLNPLGFNCLRTLPIFGNVCWGARTLDGADQQASEWKYIPVRRFALFLEESLYRGTQWVVFEPNDEPLWAQIRLNIGAFLQNLFRQGAFQGATPRQAYFVRCDHETTTQTDINLGIVNIVVGFAPLKPAEFVIIKIQQMAGEIET
jgi:Bacteriophage tail sheath protein